METPQFIFDLLENELYSIQLNLLEKVSVRYNLNKDSLVEEFLPKKLVIIPNTKTAIEVKKRIMPQQPPCGDKRCMARVWNRGKGGQCMRARIIENATDIATNDYCLQHKKNRKHGKITEPASHNIFPHVSHAIYK
jgi:hypothetical protein